MNFEQFAAAVSSADASYSDGRWQAALEAYIEVARDYLAARRPDNNFLLIAERIADIGVLLRRKGLADFYADLARIAGLLELPVVRATLLLKKVQVHLAAFDLLAAEATWEELETCLGALPPYPLTPDAARKWEASLILPADSQAALLSQCYLQWGHSQAAHGLYSDAIASYDLGLARVSGAESGRSLSAAVQLRVRRAQALLETGELTRCEESLSEWNPDPKLFAGFLVRVLELRAKLAWLQGNPGPALAFLEAVVEQCRRRELAASEAEALLNLAELRIALMQTRRARDEVARARELAPGDGAVDARSAYLDSLAEARGSTQFEREAIVPPAFMARMQHTHFAATNPIPRNEISLRLDFGQFERDETRVLGLLHCGEFQRGEFHVERLCEGYQHCDSRLVKARLKALRGIVLYYAGKRAGAKLSLREARNEFEQMGCLSDLYQSLRFLYFIEKDEGSADEAARSRKSAFQVLTRIADSLPAEARIVYLLTKWDETDSEFATRIEALTALKARSQAVGGFARLRLRLKLWQALHCFVNSVYAARDQLAAELSRDAAPTAPPAGCSLIRRLLLHPYTSRTIGYLQLPNKIFYYHLGWMRFDFLEVESPRNEVRDQLTAFHAGDGEDWRIINGLAEKIGLVKLLEALPGHIRSLTIVPDGALHYVPFSAIRIGGKYLIERFALSLQFRLQTDSPHPRQTGGSGLVVGLSDTGSRDWAPLPNVLTEVRDAGEWMDGTKLQGTVLLNQDASVEAVIQRLSRARVAWFSCHGKFDPQDPAQSGIVLHQGRLLDLKLLATLRTPQLEHATLSLCWAAESLVIPGHWLMSLPLLLQRAGCRSVLAPLWHAEDRVAREIASEFIHLATRHGRREALALAIRSLLHRDSSRQADPYLWACFQLYGESGKLRLGTSARRQR